jgi:hypothetical protein
MAVDGVRQPGAAAGLNAGVGLGYVRVGTVADWAKWAVREERVIGLLGENMPRQKKGNEADWANSSENWDWAHSYI